MERAALILCLAAAQAWGFDAGGVALGDAEAAVRKAFPEARCRPMDWETRAADRRCDDGPLPVEGTQARVTFYLREGVVQAFDLRFDAQAFDAVAARLKARYGVPERERVETFERRGEKRRVRKLRWSDGADRAELSAQLGRRRAELNAWRGSFDRDVYEPR